MGRMLADRDRVPVLWDTDGLSILLYGWLIIHNSLHTDPWPIGSRLRTEMPVTSRAAKLYGQASCLEPYQELCHQTGVAHLTDLARLYSIVMASIEIGL